MTKKELTYEVKILLSYFKWKKEFILNIKY